MVVAPGDATASGTWALNDQGAQSPFVLSSGDGGITWASTGSTITTPAFDVIGNAPAGQRF
jgi:hypothetical protein